MEMIIAITLLCSHKTPSKVLECQQLYIHCVQVKTFQMTNEEALKKCIMEKK